jgi:hypothetical protein
MDVPIEYAAISVPLTHGSFTRPAAITFAVHDDNSTGNPTDIADAVTDALEDHFIERLDSNVTMGPVVAYLGVAGGTIPGTATTSSPGTLSINSPPPNTAVLVKKVANAAGRKGRGRMFVPWFIDKGSIDEMGVLDGTQRGNIEAVLAALQAELITNGVTMFLLHADNSAPSAVLQLLVDPLIGVQSKRLGR